MTPSQIIDKLLAERGPDWVCDQLAPFVSRARMTRIEQVLAQRIAGLTVGLVHLYDPHNGAAAIRTAEGMGLSSIHAAEGENQPFRVSPKVTIGCDKWISVQRHKNTSSMAETLHAQNFRLWAAVVDGATDVADIPLGEKVALIFGNERDGLSPQDQALCDGTFRLPMWGFTQSYNLSVSVGMSLMALVPKLRARLTRPGDLTRAERRRLRALWMARSVKAADAILTRALTDERPDRPHGAAHTPDPTKPVKK